MKRLLIKTVAATLAASLIVLAPGLDCYRAAAQVFTETPVQGGAPAGGRALLVLPGGVTAPGVAQTSGGLLSPRGGTGARFRVRSFMEPVRTAGPLRPMTAVET